MDGDVAPLDKICALADKYNVPYHQLAAAAADV
jgi:hypothetical protein